MNTLFKAIALVFVLFICYIIYAANTGLDSIFFDVVNGLPFGDKMGHFFLFGVLTLLINFALKYKEFKLFIKLPIGTCIVAIVVLIEEISQGFIPNRTLDITDLLADVLGILLFSYLGKIWYNLSFQRRSTKT
ncbi:VanZ family protein [Winogradskyella eckloniae]|uniref:VanZ family protein n=1 Tax=Winogradskyella eckloniae TaxID=1089306 RepID=UPI00156596BD|nr:VanZ family protein [Winogradskyella eckloniae]NRD21161.1 VanZ family protein [Winogradskyella eckloniae]